MRITLRERECKDGNKSLYLDITYDGKRTYEYLGLYLVPEVNKDARLRNENAMKRALAIRAEYVLHPERIKRNREQKAKESTAYPNIRTLSEWLDQYEVLMFQGGASVSIMNMIRNVNGIIRLYLNRIKRPNLLIAKTDKAFIQGFSAWLRTEYKSSKATKNVCGLSQSSLEHYQMRLNCVLNRAVREGVIKRNPFYSLSREERIKTVAAKREYLTKDELERFLAVPTDGKAVQQAFGFASFTGLRKSDIIALTWDSIQTKGSNKFVFITMRKTQEPVLVPLGKMALRYLPEKPDSAAASDKVFHLPTNTAIQVSCKWIANKAGINKNVSFNTSRHTFATLTLAACKDIKTVSKLLGHKSVLTTQIYADVQMPGKVEAVNRVNGKFGSIRE
ncbi:MAG: site-specific integrase [Prevotella sp.]|nr:site-specific integrase [Prevotella sp.]